MKIGKIVGSVVFAGATAAIWLWPQAEAPAVVEPPVRPVKSIVVEGVASLPEAKFTGVVKANARRTLSFKESGRVQSIPVSGGQKVKKGDKLACLFDGDFTNQVENCRAAAERDRLSFKRLSDAAKKNAVSKEEVSKAETQLRQSEAQLALAERALRATVIYAPFDCVVARTIATELEVVNGSEPIVEVQDLSSLKIDVAVPETVVIMQKHVKCAPGMKCYATFDSFPSRRYEVQFIEYTARADDKTQTFTATYSMERPQDLLVLPGMSATITVPPGFCLLNDSTAEGVVAVPESAVGVDDAGVYYVWKLEGGEGGVYTARKRTLAKFERVGDRLYVREGLVRGDRIAAAGVTVLTEGRRVSLFK